MWLQCQWPNERYEAGPYFSEVFQDWAVADLQTKTRYHVGESQLFCFLVYSCSSSSDWKSAHRGRYCQTETASLVPAYTSLGTCLLGHICRSLSREGMWTCVSVLNHTEAQLVPSEDHLWLHPHWWWRVEQTTQSQQCCVWSPQSDCQTPG